jgi:serine/threonine protein kinase
MGAVYRARDARLGRDVAVKVLPAGALADADAVLRFEREAKAVGALNHPAVVAVFDVGNHDGLHYVVSELLEGETLRKRLAGSSLSVRKALDYAIQIAHGLAAAHEKRIVHRDLKPDNIFVTRDGQVKILDFGLAKRAPTQLGGNESTWSLSEYAPGTDPGSVMGTIGYMAPEQLQGRPVDVRSDIFSYGAVLYEMLAGRRAFRGENPADTMAAIIQREPTELSQIRPEVTPGLERIVARCLEKRPEERFQSARDVAFAFEALSAGSGSGRHFGGRSGDGAAARPPASCSPSPWAVPSWPGVSRRRTRSPCSSGSASSGDPSAPRDSCPTAGPSCTVPGEKPVVRGCSARTPPPRRTQWTCPPAPCLGSHRRERWPSSSAGRPMPRARSPVFPLLEAHREP